MHELSLVQGILDVAQRAARKGGAQKILTVYVKVGAFSGVVPSYMDECFHVMTKGTMAEGAELVVEEIPVTIRCQSCGAESTIERSSPRCPVCGSDSITMLTGRECFVDRLEAE